MASPALANEGGGISSPSASLNGQTKPTKERIRVGRACDSCKRKKVRCTGTRPCQQCTNDSISCEYNTPYSRGKRRKRPLPDSPSSSSSAYLPPSPATAGGPEDHLQTLDETPADGLQGPKFPPPFRALAPEQLNSTVGHSSRASPEPGESDRQGHFVGASSGLSFMLRLQRRLRRDIDGVPETSVFTLGDPVLPQFDELAFMPPPREEAEALLTTYFELASPTYRFLHRPTLEEWLRQLYDKGSISGPFAHSKYAVILSMFSQATRYITASNTPDANTGLLYFQAAESQLSREKEAATLTSVQALLGCCFYVLTRSRLNHCWSLFGTTSRLILALGLHRRTAKFNDDQSGGPGGYIESECRKRLFWCAYTLDKYLSAIFGRPCAFHDGDIDQDFPALVEDRNLTADSRIIDAQDNMNTMLAPLNHQKIGKILSATLRRLYGIGTLDRVTQYRIMSELGGQVEAWKQELPLFLNPDKVDSRVLIPLFQRQSNLLSLASGHALMLIYRPCLFNHYKRRERRDDEETNANVQRCLDAAMNIVSVIDHMVEAGQFYSASWFSHYQAFCAVVVLYTYTIRNQLEDPSTWLNYFRAAERCQHLIATVASADSLGQRFFVIMEEFRLEVVKQLHGDQLQGESSPRAQSIMQSAARSSPGQVYGANAGDLLAMPSGIGTDTSSWLGNTGQDYPLQPFIELPNWEQLDSLALDLGDMMVPGLDIIGHGDAFGH